MFKTEISEIGRFQLDQSKPFGWLENKGDHDCHMGLECAESLDYDLKKLVHECSKLHINLPGNFMLLLSSPKLLKKFRSINAGFFYLRKEPVKCPRSEGYLIPFISDQQYCHYYAMHLLQNDTEHQVVWANDTYFGAVYATEEEFKEDYEQDFDINDIYLCDNNFEHFMKCHYETHESWYRKNQQ